MKPEQYKIQQTDVSFEGMQLGKLLFHPFASRKHAVYVTEDKKPQTTRRLQLLSVVRDSGGNRLPAAPLALSY